MVDGIPYGIWGNSGYKLLNVLYVLSPLVWSRKWLFEIYKTWYIVQHNHWQHYMLADVIYEPQKNSVVAITLWNQKGFDVHMAQ